MRIVEQTPDRLVIETAPDDWDKLIFAVPIIGAAAGIAAFGMWGWSFISATLVLCVPIAALFLVNYKSFFGLKHTYYLDKSRNEFIIREQHGSKTKQLRSTVSELESLERETIGVDPPCFYIVVRRKTLPRSRLEVDGLFPDDEAAFDTIRSFLGG
jgi:hypothetical protein